MSIRPEGRALGDWQLRSGGGEVGDDGGGLRGADDGGAGGGGAAWRDERALGHLAARGVLGVGHHDARVVHVLVVAAPVRQARVFRDGHVLLVTAPVRHWSRSASHRTCKTATRV